jgi:hypothetical protein
MWTARNCFVVRLQWRPLGAGADREMFQVLSVRDEKIREWRTTGVVGKPPRRQNGSLVRLDADSPRPGSASCCDAYGSITGIGDAPGDLARMAVRGQAVEAPIRRYSGQSVRDFGTLFGGHVPSARCADRCGSGGPVDVVGAHVRRRLAAHPRALRRVRSVDGRRDHARRSESGCHASDLQRKILGPLAWSAR